MNRQHSTAAAFALVSGAAAHAAPSLEAYDNLPLVELMRVSASGSRVAMIGVPEDQRRLVVTCLGQD